MKLKKKSHQVQHQFNGRVEDCIKKAKEEMKKPTSKSTLTKITLALEEGLELIAKHQKMIKIADCSEYRWQVVAKYEMKRTSLHLEARMKRR